MEKIKKNKNFTFFENRKINLTQFSESRTSRIEPIQTNQNNTKIKQKIEKFTKTKISRFPKIEKLT